jgi:hypothetical protein
MIVSRNVKRWGALLIIGILAAFGGGAALAAPDDGANVGRGSGAMTVTVTDPGIYPELLAKQKEIDDFVFGTGSEELAKLGFKVTHTAPVGDRVEIGIVPYEENYAKFLYEKFGRDKVSVVEGFVAVPVKEPTYTILPAPADEGAAPDAVSNRANPDQPVSSYAKNVASDTPAVTADSVAAPAAGAMEIFKTQANQAEEAADAVAAAKSPLASSLLYVAGAIVLIAITLVAGRKRLFANK